MIVDASITKFRTSEREMAKQHINTLNNKKFLNNSIVIFDRGYPSYDMFDYLNDKNLFFLMRVSSSFKIVQSISSEDYILKYKIKGELKKIRVILVKPKLRNKILRIILEKAIKIRSQIRPNRSCERKNKHPRKKHHHNMKACI